MSCKGSHRKDFADLIGSIGTFIGFGCGVAALAGLMSWWEGRKVKKIEGPEVKVVDV
jgi:hypothetical protein